MYGNILKYLELSEIRMHRGILGVKKDPKRQMLFSFKVREGEEMASDSDDSDYEPPGEEGAARY